MANTATLTWDQITTLTNSVNQLQSTLNIKNSIYQDASTPAIIKGIQDITFITSRATVTFDAKNLIKEVTTANIQSQAGLAGQVEIINM
jgi:hypothetical protein